MASYAAVTAVLDALRRFFEARLDTFASGDDAAPTIRVMGSANFREQISGNMLGIYLHRMTIDPHGRQRSFGAGAAGTAGPRPELPVNLHLLLISTGSPAVEAGLMSWALIQLANESTLDSSQLAEAEGADITPSEIITVVPEEMTTEDLMRIWDTLDAPYTTSVPVIVRTLRLALNEERTAGGPVRTRVFELQPQGRARGNG